STQFRRSLLATFLLLVAVWSDYATVGWAKAARALIGLMASAPPCPRGHRRRVGTAARSSCHHGDASAAFATLRRRRFGAALRRAAQGGENPGIGRAAAEMAGKIRRDVVVARIGIGIEQLPHHQNEPRRAEAALKGACLDERLLHRIETRRGFQRFDRL